MLRNRPLVRPDGLSAAPGFAPTLAPFLGIEPRREHRLSPEGATARLRVLPSLSPAAGEARREPSPSPHGTPPGPGGMPRPSLLQDLLRLSTHRLSAFLAEAAVLVLVLGILERFLTSHRVELRWIAVVVSTSVALLVGSVALELTGQRRAGAS